MDRAHYVFLFRFKTQFVFLRFCGGLCKFVDNIKQTKSIKLYRIMDVIFFFSKLILIYFLFGFDIRVFLTADSLKNYRYNYIV